MKKLILLLIPLFITGCAGTQLSPDMISSLGLKEGTKIIADDMTVKQLALYKLHTDVAKAYYKAKENPTFTLTPKVQEIGGLIFISHVIEYREKPETIRLPEKLDIHPIWNTMSEIGKLGLIGYGVHELAGAITGMQGTSTYNGDVYGSFNSSGTSQAVSSYRDYITTTTTTTTNTGWE